MCAVCCRRGLSCVVVKLGAIRVKSAPRAAALDVHGLYKAGLADDDILREITKHSYDKMALELTDMQVRAQASCSP